MGTAIDLCRGMALFGFNFILKAFQKKAVSRCEKASSLRKKMQLMFLVLTAFAFTSCSEYLKGKPFKTDYLEIKADGKLACLDNVADDLQKFLDSEGTNDQIDQTVDCINTTLTELQTRVEGRAEASSFTANEVYQILSTFAAKAKVTSESAKNIIFLKAALLGGDKGKITKKEIDLLKNYLVLVKAEAKKLKPYIKIFYFKTTERAYTKAYINEAFALLNATIRNLYRNSQLANSTYSFDEFKDMLINVLNLSDDKKSMVEIGAKVNALLNGTQTILTEAERLAYIDNITEALRIYALYSNGYAKFEINTSAHMNDTINFLELAINLIENSLQYKKTQQISAATIDGFVSSVVNSNILSYKVSSYTAAMFYRTILVRVFESGASGVITNFTALKSFHIRNIKRELGTFKLYSKLIERVASEQLFEQRGIQTAPLGELKNAMAQLNIAAETEILSKYDATSQSVIINNVNDLRSEFLSANPIIFKNKKLAVATNQNTWDQKWKDLSRALYVKMLSRLLMQGWGAIYPMENINTNYVTETAMTNWYGEFKHFFIAMKSFDPRTHNSGPASVKIGNLFTRNGNGDDRLNYKELTENLAILLTGSSVTEAEITDALITGRCNMPALDVFDKNWNHESCFYRVIRANYRFFFSSMPHLVAYLDTLNESQFNEYIKAVVDVVRTETGSSGVKIETSDIRSMTALLAYIEGAFLVHDANQNWHLSESEIKTAYPKFQLIATDFANKTSRDQIEEFTSWKGDAAGYGCFSEQDLIRESFVYLVFNGRNPSQSDMNSFPCFRSKPLLDFHGEVNRRTMVEALKALKEVFVGN